MIFRLVSLLDHFVFLTKVDYFLDLGKVTNVSFGILATSTSGIFSNFGGPNGTLKVKIGFFIYF